MENHEHKFTASTKALQSKLLPSVRFECKCGESVAERYAGDKYAEYLNAKYVRPTKEQPVADIDQIVEFPVRWDALSQQVVSANDWAVAEAYCDKITDANALGEYIAAALNEKFNRENYPTEPDIIAAGYDKIETGAFKRKAE